MQSDACCLNERALALVKQLVADKETLGVELLSLAGANVLDAGVNYPGSLAAGRLVAEVCLGGLGQVNPVQLFFPGLTPNAPSFWLPGVQVTVEKPAISCLASQYAGWAVEGHGFFALGSGPARALAAKEDVFKILAYQEQATIGILVLEADRLPPDELVHELALDFGLEPKNLWLVVAPTASIVGSVQVAARVVETGLHKLLTLDYDVHQVKAAYGTCPLAPVAADDLTALGRTNDAVLYGGRCFYFVNDQNDDIEQLMDRVPASASPDWGTPFLQLFKRYGDFYKMDPLLFSPAEIMVNNAANGKTYRAGKVNSKLLEHSLLGVIAR
jgi:methenyltetrahydromethanopterin cyclohydrolase